MRAAIELCAVGLVVLGTAGCSGPGIDEGRPRVLAVEAGSALVQTVLSGTAEASQAIALVAPDVGVSPVRIRHLVENGDDVAEGDVVAELDNSGLVANLEQLEGNAIQAETTWLSTRARVGTELETARFDVLQKQAEYDKAVIAARIPEDLRSAREYEQLVLTRNKSALVLGQARRALVAQEAAGEAAIAADAVALDKAIGA